MSICDADELAIGSIKPCQVFTFWELKIAVVICCGQRNERARARVKAMIIDPGDERIAYAWFARKTQVFEVLIKNMAVGIQREMPARTLGTPQLLGWPRCQRLYQ